MPGPTRAPPASRRWARGGSGLQVRVVLDRLQARHLCDARGNDLRIRHDPRRLDVAPLEGEAADAELDAAQRQLVDVRHERAAARRLGLLASKSMPRPGAA